MPLFRNGVEPFVFRVDGNPVPDGRPRWTRRTGHMHRDRKADPWKHAVRAAAFLALGRLGPVELIPRGVAIGVDLVFVFPRPPEHVDGGELRRGAPVFHAETPDKDNAEKAVLDALGRFDKLPNLIWTDDRQVATGRTTKRFADPGEFPGVVVSVYPLHIPFHTAARTMTDNAILLTTGEALAISRRRSGLTIAEASELFGYSIGVWCAWEKDCRIDPPSCPRVDVGELSAGEWCWLLRRRHNLQARDVSALTGLGAQWITRAESGVVDATPLVEWWGRYLTMFAKKNPAT